jgi:hypothetical protein
VGIKTHSRQPLLPPAFLEAEAAIPAQPLSEAINGEELPRIRFGVALVNGDVREVVPSSATAARRD